MKRSTAALLAVLFGWLLLLPFFPASAAGSLPACCRKSGKHQCALSEAGQQASSGLRKSCPHSENGALAAASSGLFAVPQSIGYAYLVVLGLLLAGTRRGYRPAFTFSRPQRGPPVLSLVS